MTYQILYELYTCMNLTIAFVFYVDKIMSLIRYYYYYYKYFNAEIEHQNKIQILLVVKISYWVI